MKEEKKRKEHEEKEKEKEKEDKEGKEKGFLKKLPQIVSILKSDEPKEKEKPKRFLWFLCFHANRAATCRTLAINQYRLHAQTRLTSQHNSHERIRAIALDLKRRQSQ
jgi:hypothetical protein